MPNEPQIRVLSYKKRLWMFWTLFIIFILAMPALIFYTSGNRLIFDDSETNIVSMGGIYLGNDLDDIDVYIDEVRIEKSRLFRQALYLEDISAGMHRVHVQEPNLQTWVKRLPVYPGIVTETFSFNLPVVPEVRLITEYVTPTGTSVLRGLATTTDWWPEAVITNDLVATTSRATTTLVQNPEHEYVTQLFTATTTTARLSVLERMQTELEDRFTFNSVSSTPGTSTPTTTVERQNIQLAEKGSEIEALWQGESDEAPFYFCIRYDTASTTAARYGTQVARDVESELARKKETVLSGERYCRDSIQLNRLEQDVYLFDFLPGSTDLVVLHLEDGLYVSEIDDRSWQNTQLLYPGEDLVVLIDNGSIFVYDGERYFEVATTLDGIS